MSEKLRGSLLRLGLKNIRNYKWINAKLCAAFAFLSFLMCMFTVYNIAIRENRRDVERDYRSSNYIYYMGSKESDISAIQEYAGKYASNTEPRVCRSSSKMTARVAKAQGTSEPEYLTANYIGIELGGKSLTSEDDTTRATVYGGDIFIPSADIEMKKKFGYDSCYWGSVPAGKDEAMLSQALLDAFDLTVDDVMGKDVAISILGESQPFFTGKVSGVARREYIQLSGYTSMNIGILLSVDADVLKSGSTRMIFPLDKWMGTDAYSELLNVVGKTKCIYRGAFAGNVLEDLGKVQVLANTLYIIIGTSLLVGVVLTVFVMLGKYVKVFSRTGGILLFSGMPRKRLYALLAVQLAILCVIAIPFALVLTAFGNYVINAMLTSLLHFSFSISDGLFALMLALGIFSVIAIAAVFYLCSLYTMSNKTVRELLITTVN